RIEQAERSGPCVELVVAVAGAPLRDELVDPLQVPARLARRIVARHGAERRRGGVVGEAARLLAAEVFALQLEVLIGWIAVRRPLQDAVGHPEPARPAEAVGHRSAA